MSEPITIDEALDQQARALSAQHLAIVAHIKAQKQGTCDGCRHWGPNQGKPDIDPITGSCRNPNVTDYGVSLVAGNASGPVMPAKKPDRTIGPWVMFCVFIACYPLLLWHLLSGVHEAAETKTGYVFGVVITFCGLAVWLAIASGIVYVIGVAT